MPNPSPRVARPHIPPHDLVTDSAFPHSSALPCALWKSCSCTLNLFKGTPVLPAWTEIWVTLELPALLPLRSFRIPPQGGVACFSVPLNIFINPLLRLAVQVYRTKEPCSCRDSLSVEDVAFSGSAWVNLLNEDSWLPASLSTPPILLGDSCQHPALQSLTY